MKNMKKYLSLLLALAMCLSLLALSACSGSDDEDETSDAGTSESSDANTETSDSAETDPSSYGDDVVAIIESGVLKVGVKDAVEGFGYQDTLTGERSGLEIDLANMIAEYLGVEVEFTTVTAATRTELLDSGDIDCVLATFTITDERKESWDFTTPYYTDHVSVLVENSSGITTLQDLVDNSAVVGVSSGSTSARSLVEALIDNGIIEGADYSADTFDATTWTEGVSFQVYDDYPAISTALSANEVQAFCVDKSILSIYNTDSRTYIEEEFAAQDYGIATTKDSGMSALCEDLITGWLADGTIDSLIESNGID
ncbi:MAG: transporter substrate-binding domain-containing protein [Oscillospiraceae bacterium]|nr:transporter substrate-binding domain-containing protein [Oscillospiraceae bacterium]